MKGFNSLYEKYDLSFDQTYYDLCLDLDLPEVRREYLHEGVRWAMAEGFRKASVLYRLMETGSVQPGQSGPLFWDEPEANLNPRLIRLLVQILLELSREGQQIILATHDYVFIKWLDLLMDKEAGDHVRYHVLSRDDCGEISLQMVDDYGAIPPNSIANAFTDAIDGMVFDQMDRNRPNYHSIGEMHRVDFIVEFENAILFVEIKDPENPRATERGLSKFYDELENGTLSSTFASKLIGNFPQWPARRIEGELDEEEV